MYDETTNDGDAGSEPSLQEDRKMGKEAKIGVAAVLLLLVAFVVVLGWRLSHLSEDSVATFSTDGNPTEDSPAPQGDGDMAAAVSVASAGSPEPTMLAAKPTSWRPPTATSDGGAGWASTGNEMLSTSTADMAAAPVNSYMGGATEPTEVVPHEQYGAEQSAFAVRPSPALSGNGTMPPAFAPQQEPLPPEPAPLQPSGGDSMSGEGSVGGLRVLGPPSASVPSTVIAPGSSFYDVPPSSANSMPLATPPTPTYRETSRYTYQAQPSFNQVSVRNEPAVTPRPYATTRPAYAEAYPDDYLAQMPDYASRQMMQAVSSRDGHLTDNAYTVQEGDTLFGIARYELKKASRWPEIYRLNRDMLGDDFGHLTPGIRLVMPDDDRPAETVAQRPDTRSIYHR